MIGKLKNILLDNKIKNDDYQELLLDFQNLKRNKEREIAELKKNASLDFIADLLPIVDDLEIAAKCHDGCGYINKKIQALLKNYGVYQFGEVGDIFDDDCHEAVRTVEYLNRGHLEITRIFKTGYRTQDKIIRHATVEVNIKK